MEATPHALSVIRARNKKITLFFSFFFAFIFLSISAIIIYLMLDISIESTASSFNPSPPLILKNQNLSLTLQAAALQLQNTTTFLESVPDLRNCSNLLRAGLGEIQDPIEDQGDRGREMRERIEKAEQHVELCLVILEKVQPMAKVVHIARRKLLRAYESLRRCSYLVDIMGWGAQKEFGWLGGNFRAQNLLIMVFLGGMQLSAVGYLFWIIRKFRCER